MREMSKDNSRSLELLSDADKKFFDKATEIINKTCKEEGLKSPLSYNIELSQEQITLICTNLRKENIAPDKALQRIANCTSKQYFSLFRVPDREGKRVPQWFFATSESLGEKVPKLFHIEETSKPGVLLYGLGSQDDIDLDDFYKVLADVRDTLSLTGYKYIYCEDYTALVTLNLFMSFLDKQEVKQPVEEIITENLNKSFLQHHASNTAVLPANEIETFYGGESILFKKMFDGTHTPGTSGKTKPTEIDVSSRNAKEPLRVYCAVTLPELVEEGILSTSKPLTSYDELAINLLITIYENQRINGNEHIFSAKQFAERMYGQNFSPDVNSKTINEIVKYIDSCISALVYIDATEQVREYTERDAERKAALEGFRVRQKDNLFPLKGIDVIDRNGNIQTSAYKFKNEPLLLQYLRATGQIHSYPFEMTRPLLPSGKPIRQDRGTSILTHYLCARIETLRNKSEKIQDTTHLRIILFSSIYKEYGEGTELDKTTRKRVRDKAIDILSFYKRSGYIKDFIIICRKTGVFEKIEFSLSKEYDSKERNYTEKNGIKIATEKPCKRRSAGAANSGTT